MPFCWQRSQNLSVYINNLCVWWGLPLCACNNRNMNHLEFILTCKQSAQEIRGLSQTIVQTFFLPTIAHILLFERFFRKMSSLYSSGSKFWKSIQWFLYYKCFLIFFKILLSKKFANRLSLFPRCLGSTPRLWTLKSAFADVYTSRALLVYLV